MGKISPISIKYMIHANFIAEGALEKPDVIGAIFGQTEGLLGADLELRELQKEGKIGRIEVNLERGNKRTTGTIKIPTALDRTETTLIAAAIETIDRVGPTDAQIEIESIEDVRGSKRDYIIERAKKLMKDVHGIADSREIFSEIRDSMKIAGIAEYGKNKLPCGDISGKEVIVVEGRADVVNLLKNGIKNVIAMDGTKLSDDIKELGEEKELTLFIDGDRGGKLIAQNVIDNANIKNVVIAPDGKEVEELTSKEIWMALRRKVPVEEFLPGKYKQKTKQETKLENGEREKLREISKENNGNGKSVLLNDSLEKMRELSVKGTANAIRKIKNKPSFIVIDGTATNTIIRAAEDAKCKAIVAKNFATTDTSLELLSF